MQRSRASLVLRNARYHSFRSAKVIVESPAESSARRESMPFSIVYAFGLEGCRITAADYGEDADADNSINWDTAFSAL